MFFFIVYAWSGAVVGLLALVATLWLANTPWYRRNYSDLEQGQEILFPAGSGQVALPLAGRGQVVFTSSSSRKLLEFWEVPA